MKRYPVILFVACFMWLVASNNALAQLPTPMKNTYVHDFANVLSPAVKEELNQYSTQLDQGTGAEIMVVTLDSIHGQEAKMYATKLIRAWGIGDAEKNNGVLLLATFGQGQGKNDVVIAVGQGLEGALPDGKLGRILDEAFYPSASNGQVDQAFQATYAELFQTVATEYNWAGDMPTQAVEDESMPTWLFVLIVIIVLVVIFSNGGGGPRSRGRGGYPGGFGGGFGRGGSGGGGFGGFGGGSSAGGGASRKF